MKYDKIRGSSIAEMMMQLRSQFGNSVYILQTREIRQGGLFGSDLLSRKQFEIEYMVSEGDGTPARSPRKSTSGGSSRANMAPALRLPVRTPSLPEPRPGSILSEDSTGTGKQGTQERPRSANIRPATAAIETNLHDLDALIDSLKRLKERSGSRPASETVRPQDLPEGGDESALKPVRDEEAVSQEPLVQARSESQALIQKRPVIAPADLDDEDLAAGMPTREELEALFSPGPEETYGGVSMSQRSQQPAPLLQPGISSRLPRIPLPEGEDAFSRIHRRLLENQTSPEFADRFMHRLERSLSQEDRQHPARVRTRSLEKLKEMIRLTPTIEREHGERKVVFLVGPNGAGKTTSLAKLAARYQINEGASVSVFSLDHYRLAATEQLKTYAAVLMVPFHAPVSPAEFLEFLDRDSPDYVFVDTSGMSLRDHDRLEDLRRYIDSVPGSVEVHLVLSVSTSPSLTEKYMNFFDAVGFEKIILTRLDETDFLGNFVEAADKWKRPFSFLMNGQTVPEHVLQADSEDLARMVLGLSG